MRLLPKLLSEDEAAWWGLTEMIPDFPPEEILAIEAKWSKKALQEMADEYMLDRRGDKELLIHKLLYVGALDEEGEPTGLPVGEPAYAISNNPRKFCCRLCDVCAPEHLLEKGRFLERITWLREHYKVAHPGKWGKRT